MKETLRRLVRSAGWELRRFGVDVSADLRLARFLDHAQIDCILDVGANTGQFARMLRRIRYAGTIVSFEPLAKAHVALVEASRNDNSWVIAPRMALGASNGSVQMHIAANSCSSSVLPMLESHVSAAPESAYMACEDVPLRRLDDVAATMFPADARLLLKIDVQGYEAEVLRGAPLIAHRAAALMVELSLVPLYEGQPLFDDMYHIIDQLGFEPWSFDAGFREQKNGRLLQLDALFTRRPADAGVRENIR